MQSAVSQAPPSPASRAHRRDSRPLLARLADHPDVLLSVGLFVVALVPRLLYLVWAPVFIGGDSLQYYQPVYDLINTGKFTLSLKRPPLYPWLLYASEVTFGQGFVPVIAFQHLLGAIGVVLTYGIARLAWGRDDVVRRRWIGVLAALLVAFSSPTLRWEHFLMSEGLFTFLFTLMVFLIVLGLRRAGLVALGSGRPRARAGDPDALGGPGRAVRGAADDPAGASAPGGRRSPRRC